MPTLNFALYMKLISVCAVFTTFILHIFFIALVDLYGRINNFKYSVTVSHKGVTFAVPKYICI